MNDPRLVEHNLDNLRYVSERLAHLPYFLFYGTLLGYQREGNIIPNDDDIDLMIDRVHHDEIKEIFKGTEVFIRHRRAEFRTGFFLQGVRVIDDVQTFIDFYLYQDLEDRSYVSEHWNFTGKNGTDATALHVPKRAIYPIQDATMQGIDVKVPANPKACCAFLYGKNWRTPRSKDTDYRMEVRNHRPVMVKQNNGQAPK